MKNTILLIILLSCGAIAFSQTFPNGFDKRDASYSGGNGQGLSLHSNVKSDIHNEETVYLKGGNSATKNRHGVALSTSTTYLLEDNFDLFNFSYSIELDYQMIIKNNLLIQAGVSYEDLKSYRLITLSFNSILMDRHIYNYYKFVGFPLRINYIYSWQKLSLSAGVGNLFSILTIMHPNPSTG